MIDIISYGKLKSCGKQKKKKQIILCHTSREVGEYLTSLEFRYSSGYGKIPNYLVDRSGKVYKLLDDEEYGKIFEVENINRNSIIICLENLGWLEKKPLSNDYINWIGNIYKIRGIVSRSNFDTYHTDLNPSFDFENFQKKIKNG